jgi:acyl carrier protein
MLHTDHDIFGFLKQKLLEFLDIEEEAITPDAEIASLGLESLDFIELQVELEKAYGVQVQSSVFAEGEIRTMSQFVSYVQGLMDSRRAAAV